MIRQELIRDIKKECGNFPASSQIDKYVGKRKGFYKELMQGIEPWRDGRAKKYTATDVADRLIARGII